MNERIKKLRKALELTQKEFASRLGIKQNTIAKYETNRGNPTVAVISLICREFNVNEDWLRTGSGPMFKATEEAAVSKLCRELHASVIEAGIIRAYFRIPPEIRDTFMRRLMEEVQTEYNLDIPGLKFKTTDDLLADLEDWRQETIAEREARKGSGSASGGSSSSDTA